MAKVLLGHDTKFYAMNRTELPIYEVEAEVVRQASAGPRLVVTAPTGSGKSTQVPQMLLDHGLLGAGQVVILQPRRLPARLLAARVAQERGTRLGDEVGYQVRFDDVSGARTRIKYETEGILLRQLLANPRLEGVSAIIFDEFHERHLYGDVTLARALQIQESTRPDLKLLVMSATLAAEPVRRYLDPCGMVASEGRTFPVSIQYIEDRPPRPGGRDVAPAAWDLAAREFERAVREGVPGDVLVFMPGAYEIGRACDAIRHSSASAGFIILPLHGELPVRDQDAAVARYDRRKVVVSTNVAESSLTIDGIRLVIDSGLARIPRFDPHRGINTLLIEKISRASADQRAGRAGRTAPGLCVRLWTQREQLERAPQEEPEIRRLDLSEILLTLKAGGVEDVRAFRWMDPPDPKSLDRAERLLGDLGALDARTGALTGLGRRMVAFPVHPRYARMLLAAGGSGCVRATALVSALTQGRNLLFRAGGGVRDDRETFLGDEEHSDFFVLMRAWSYAEKNGFDVERCRRLGINASAARQVRPLFQYFLDIAAREGLPIETSAADDEAVQKCVLSGFSDQLARRLDTGTLRCALVHGRRGVLARESVVRKSPLLVAAEVREVEGRDRELNVLLTLATAVKEDWLRAMFPGDFSEQDEVAFDDAARRVIAERRVLFRDLVLGSKRLAEPPADQAARVLADEVVKGRLTLKGWDHAVDQWIQRVNCLAAWCPELGVPSISADDRRAMIERVCRGSTSYKEIKDKPVMATVKSWLSGPQQALVEKHAPERLELSNGRRAKVAYSMDAPPYLSARIQDLYGVDRTPRIAMNKVTVVVHILGPNHRPVQVTQDLAGFWREHYPRIKQELQRKYPRHEWR
jgi:ATP-dependent helicase HrpB